MEPFLFYLDISSTKYLLRKTTEHFFFFNNIERFLL